MRGDFREVLVGVISDTHGLGMKRVKIPKKGERQNETIEVALSGTGTVTGLDAEHIDLKTWYAGKIRVPRSSVRSIDFGIAARVDDATLTADMDGRGTIIATGDLAMNGSFISPVASASARPTA